MPGPDGEDEDYERERVREPVAAGRPSKVAPVIDGEVLAGPSGAATAAGPAGAAMTGGPRRPGDSGISLGDPHDIDDLGDLDGPADADDEDPPDEPAPQLTSPADAARVARLPIEVLVVDGRPRYHLVGCVHLHGRDAEALAVSEAVELGFTPCSLCEPDSALIAEARRG
jgi:hypothetical protein